MKRDCSRNKLSDPTKARYRAACDATSMPELADGENYAGFAGGFVPNFFYLGKRNDLGGYL